LLLQLWLEAACLLIRKHVFSGAVQDATHFRRARDPETGKEVLEPCSPGDQGAFEATLQVNALLPPLLPLPPAPPARVLLLRALLPRALL
jgi:hypothetical protein